MLTRLKVNGFKNLINVDVSAVAVDEDHRRELLTVQVRDRSRTWHAARALSDGTLRFLALAIESGPDNPLRQVIVNTHSPSVVSLVDEDDLLVAEPREIAVAGKRHRGVGFAWLHDTWLRAPHALVVHAS